MLKTKSHLQRRDREHGDGGADHDETDVRLALEMTVARPEKDTQAVCNSDQDDTCKIWSSIGHDLIHVRSIRTVEDALHVQRNELSRRRNE